jgi:hypothetical protein
MGGLFKGSTIAPQRVDLLTKAGRQFREKTIGEFDFAPQFLQGPQQLAQRTVGGGFLDIGQNPYLQQRADFLQREMGRRGDIERAGLQANIGRLGPAFSVDALRAQQELDRDISQRTAGGIAELLGPQYQFERGMQQQAAPMAAQLGFLPQTQAQALLRSLAGTSTAGTPQVGPSPFQQIAGPAASLAGGFFAGRQPQPQAQLPPFLPSPFPGSELPQAGIF